MIGAAINTKPVLVAVPPLVVTETLPLLPEATTAEIVVGEITEKEDRKSVV